MPLSLTAAELDAVTFTKALYCGDAVEAPSEVFVTISPSGNREETHVLSRYERGSSQRCP